MAEHSNRQKSWIDTFLYPMCAKKKCSPLLQIRSSVDKTLGTQVWGSELESPSTRKARYRLASHGALLLWGQGGRRSVPSQLAGMQLSRKHQRSGPITGRRKAGPVPDAAFDLHTHAKARKCRYSDTAHNTHTLKLSRKKSKGSPETASFSEAMETECWGRGKWNGRNALKRRWQLHKKTTRVLFCDSDIFTCS